MIPIFSYVNPLLLFNKIPPYKYLLFILYGQDNTNFRELLRRNMGKYHIKSGINTGLFIFDFPTDRWFRDNLQYFLERYQNSSNNDDWNIVMTEVAATIQNRQLWINELRQGNYLTLNYMDRFMKIFNIDSNNLPTIVIFMRDQATYYLKSNINIDQLEKLLNSLTSEYNFEFNHSNSYNLPDNITLPKIIAMIEDGLYPEYWEIIKSIHCLQAQKDHSRESTEKLKQIFPAFNNLKYPNAFEWHKELVKWLKKYNNIVERFVNQLNILIENPANHGLGLEKIRNFWRFRVSERYRSHYFERNGKKVCYFLGEHDYEL